METFANSFILGVIFGSIWGPWSQLKKSRNLTNTNRTKLNLGELNSMGNTLKVKYKFGAWQIL